MNLSVMWEDMKTILVAVDFSSGTEKLLKVADKLSKAFDEQVYLVHVLDDSPLYTMYGMYPEEIPAMTEYRELAKEAAKKKLSETKESLEEMGVLVLAQLLEGRPYEAITNFAEEMETDMIVVGTHGHSAIGSVLMGSVASSLVRESKVPVLVVPISQES